MRSLLAYAVLFGCGCDPTFAVRGLVYTPAVGLRPIHEGTAVVAATVRLRCPLGGAPELYVRDLCLHSGADGRFSSGGRGFIEMACTLEVEAAGYRPRSFAVRDVCTRQFDDTLCEVIDLSAALQPP